MRGQNSHSGRRLLCIRFEIDRTQSVFMRLEPTVDLLEQTRQIVRSCGDVGGDPSVLVNHIVDVASKAYNHGDVKREEIVGCAISAPGAVDDDHSRVLRASRYGLREPALVADAVKESIHVPTFVFNDSECVAYYEHVNLSPGLDRRIHLVIMAGFGIGSTLLIDGKVYKGAGHAGHLGRAPVTAFWTGGGTNELSYSLEAFSSRIAIAKALRRIFQVDMEVPGDIGDEYQRERLMALRRRIRSYDSSQEVELQDIEDAIGLGDPTVRRVVDEAARFLGIAVATSILHISPFVITCVGELFDYLSEYWEGVRHYSRLYCWPDAYKSVTLRRGERLDGQRTQFIGCGLLANNLLNK